MTYWIWEVLDWVSLPFLAALIIIFLRRTLYRELRFFFWFIVGSELATLARLVVLFTTPRTYFYIYWISELVVTTFSFLAIYELFIRRLFPRFYKIRLYRNLFVTVASMIIFLAWLTALESPNKAAALAIEARVLDFILAAALAFFVSLMLFMGRRWHMHDLGVAVGFGINAAAFLITSALWARTHYQSSRVDQLPLIAYDLACVIWLASFWRDDRNPASSDSNFSAEMLHEARTWETALRDWLTPRKKDP